MGKKGTVSGTGRERRRPGYRKRGGGPKVIALGRRGGGGGGEKGRFLRCLLFGRADRPKCRRQASIDGSLGMGLPRYFFSLSF